MLWTPIEELIKRRTNDSRNVSCGLVASDISSVLPTGTDGRRQLIITTGNPGHKESKIWDIDQMNIRELCELRDWMAVHMPNKLVYYHQGSLERQIEAVDRTDSMSHFKESVKRWYRNDLTPLEVCREAWDNALGATPPHKIERAAFLAGEEYSHTCYGQPVYHGFFIKEGKRWLITATEAQWRACFSPRDGLSAESQSPQSPTSTSAQ